MRVACLISGGKDSLYALYLARENEIKYLITISPKNKESWMFHFPCIELTKLQAEALNLKHIFKEIEGRKEEEMEELKMAINDIKNEVEGLVSGVIKSNYQKERIEKICKELGLKSITPLWGKNPEDVVREEIESGFEIIITGVFCEGLDKSWIGKKLDLSVLEELKELNKKYGINVAGEGGEFETLVLDCPLFQKKIEILESEKFWDGKTNSGYLIVKDARLISK